MAQAGVGGSEDVVELRVWAALRAEYGVEVREDGRRRGQGQVVVGDHGRRRVSGAEQDVEGGGRAGESVEGEGESARLDGEVFKEDGLAPLGGWTLLDGRLVLEVSGDWSAVDVQLSCREREAEVREVGGSDDRAWRGVEGADHFQLDVDRGGGVEALVVLRCEQILQERQQRRASALRSAQLRGGMRGRAGAGGLPWLVSASL